MILSTSKPVDKGKNLIVGLVTTHIPLRKIYKFIDQKIIFEKIVAFKNSLSKIWQIRSPKIAITSLNPHAGEEGLIGNEEIETIKPIIEKCKNKKIKVIKLLVFGQISRVVFSFQPNRIQNRLEHSHTQVNQVPQILV